MFVFNFVVFLFGLAVGSFLNCVVYRLHSGELSSKHKELSSFMRGRSFCPFCKHKLFWQDLIPVFSFLILAGKCRYCQQKISLQYPLVEISTGLLFLLIFNFQFSTCPAPNLFWCGVFNFISILSPFISILYLFIITCFLLIIFVYDLKHFIIPDKIIYPAIIIVLGFRIWDLFRISNFEFRILKPILNPFTAAIIASAFFLAIVLFSRGKWMGIGDIKLVFFMGLFLGFPNILIALFLAFLIGAIIGVGLILAKKKTLKSEVPFGPFLVTGTFIALFLGKEIIQWYLNLFI